MQGQSDVTIQHKIVTFRYHLISTLFFVILGLLLTVIACCAVILLLNVFGMQIEYITIGIMAIIFLLGGGIIIAHVTTRRLPEKYRERYLPAWLPLLVTLGLWVVVLLLTGVSRFKMIVFSIPAIFTLVFLISFLIFERQSESRPKPVDKKFTIIMISITLLTSVVICVMTLLNINIL